MAFLPSWEGALNELNRWRSNPGGRVVFTNGCFDLLHIGHLTYLEQAKSCGDYLVVALNSDQSVQSLKGVGRPILPLEERGRLLAALDCVDLVTSFEQETPLELIRKVKPDVLVKGGDWKTSEIVGGDFVESYGGEVRSLGFVPGRSTSEIISKIKGH